LSDDWQTTSMIKRAHNVRECDSQRAGVVSSRVDAAVTHFEWSVNHDWSL
jgi:hypothetical protein